VGIIKNQEVMGRTYDTYSHLSASLCMVQLARTINY